MTISDLYIFPYTHYCGQLTVGVKWKADGEQKTVYLDPKTTRNHMGSCPAKKKPVVDSKLAQALKASGMVEGKATAKDICNFLQANPLLREKFQEALK